MRFLTILFAFVVSVVRLAAREPSQQDYDVWAALMLPLAMHADRSESCHVWHMIEPTSVFARGMEKGALESHPEYRQAAKAWEEESAEIDIDRLNAAILALDQSPMIKPIKLLDQQTLKEIVGTSPKSPWIVSPRVRSGIDSICRLSWPAYREGGRAAYLISGEFTMWKGSITHTIIDKKQNDRWWPGEKAMWDLLLWGPGWPENTDNRLFIDD
jgi:hypothetical protein